MQPLECNTFDVPLLFKEMTHRILNEYSAAINMLALAAAKAADAEAQTTLQTAADRLRDHAIAYRALQLPSNEEPIDLTDHISGICRAIYRSRLHTRGIKLSVSGETVALSPEQCWYAGLIVSELVTNAAKHAFNQRTGSIWVETRSTDEQVQCGVIDDGVVAVRHPPGRGTEINEALARRLGGTVNRTFSSRGTTAILTFPRRSRIADFTLPSPRARKIAAKSYNCG
jgi:two-component sensor histidine kinase